MPDGYCSLILLNDMVRQLDSEIAMLERHNEILNESIECLMELRADIPQE